VTVRAVATAATDRAADVHPEAASVMVVVTVAGMTARAVTARPENQGRIAATSVAITGADVGLRPGQPSPSRCRLSRSATSLVPSCDKSPGTAVRFP
jgi:hypothetical protein